VSECEPWLTTMNFQWYIFGIEFVFILFIYIYILSVLDGFLSSYPKRKSFNQIHMKKNVKIFIGKKIIIHKFSSNVVAFVCMWGKCSRARTCKKSFRSFVDFCVYKLKVSQDQVWRKVKFLLPTINAKNGNQNEKSHAQSRIISCLFMACRTSIFFSFILFYFFWSLALMLTMKIEGKEKKCVLKVKWNFAISSFTLSINAMCNTERVKRKIYFFCEVH